MPIIPLHDGRPLSHVIWPYVTWGIIAANVIVFFVFQQGGLDDVDHAGLVTYGLIPALFNDAAVLPAGYAEIPDGLTLLSYAFLHGDLWHLLGNMVFLYVFADNVEDAMGHVRFLVFYCLCAVGSGYAYVLADPLSEVPVVGASGAIAGVVAAYFLLHPFQKIWVLFLGRIPLRLDAFWVLGAWIVYQVYSLLAATPDDTIAWSAHIGGLISGAVLVLFLRRRGVPLFDRGPAVQVLAVTPVKTERIRRL